MLVTRKTAAAPVPLKKGINNRLSTRLTTAQLMITMEIFLYFLAEKLSVQNKLFRNCSGIQHDNTINSKAFDSPYFPCVIYPTTGTHKIFNAKAINTAANISV